jgi:hypothetical protein
MADTNVVRLPPTHPVLAEKTFSPGQGGCLLAFGAPFLAIGAYFAWVIQVHPDWIHSEDPKPPRAILFLFAALFVGAGLMVWWPAARAMLAGLRRSRRASAHPFEPWLADRAWDPKGDRDRPIADALGSLPFFAFLALFLAPFHWWMWADTWGPGVAVIGLFDLLLLSGLAYWAYRVGRSLKYGAAFVSYDSFPFFLGGPLSVRLGCSRGLERLDRLTVTVRFVRVGKERITPQGSKTTFCEQHWAQHWAFERATLAGLREIPIATTLPHGDYETRLGADSPRYWEIEAKGEAPGIDFAAQFLLPVYPRR